MSYFIHSTRTPRLGHTDFSISDSQITMDFIVIDFETANERRNSACAIGIAIVRNGQVVDSFAKFIRPPEMRFSPWNTRIHGLTERDVANAPTFAEIWPEILPIVENQLVLAHNASFDVSVLRHTLHAAYIPIPRLTCLCTVKVSKKVWPDFPSHSLGYLASSLGIQLDHHDAQSDSLAVAALANHFMQRTGASSLYELMDALNVPPIQLSPLDNWMPTSPPVARKDSSQPPVKLPADQDFSNQVLCGKAVVFTGALTMFSRKDAFLIVEQLGGFPSESVTKHTSYLVAGSQDIRMLSEGTTESSKLRKARKLREDGFDIGILTESDFVELVISSLGYGGG